MALQSHATRVLVVDDDAMSRDLLGVLLEGEGYAVESADSGEAALALLRRPVPAPDLVLADVQMPGTTGSQLARKLRRACGPATLLLAISGSEPPAQAVSLFDGFLMKPFNMEQVAAALLAHRLHQSKWKARRVASQSKSTVVPRATMIPVSAPAQHASNQGMSVQTVEPQAEVAELSSTDSAVLNQSIYGQLAGSIPAPQLQEMYILCINDARKRIAGMRVLAAARDSAQFVREAHAIKGGCGMLGATELHHMASELEAKGLDSGRAGDAADVNFLDELSSACDRLERMLGSRV